MIPPPIPADEQQRLDAIKRYHLVQELPESIFNDITRIAADVCDTPIALFNVVGEFEQVSHANIGAKSSSMPRELSFCAHTINHPREIMVVNDARLDKRFHDHPLTQGAEAIISYAGVPVLDAEGHAMGALCVIDTEPKEFSSEKLEVLRSLARLLEAQLELRKKEMDKETIHYKLVKAKRLVSEITTKTPSEEVNQLDALLDSMERI